MVNIHSKLENDFVGFFLQHRLQYRSKRHLSSGQEYYGFSYLGKFIFNRNCFGQAMRF